MPITVNPGFVWPPDVDPVVSPDGRIMVIADPSHAGALLRANYADMADQTVRRNLAQNPIGAGATSASSWVVSPGETLTFIPSDGGHPCVEANDPVGGGGLYADPTSVVAGEVPPVGHWVAFGVDVRPTAAEYGPTMRLVIQGYSGVTVSGGTLAQSIPVGVYTRLTVAAQVTATDPAGFMRTLVWPTTTTAVGGFRARRATVAVGATQSDALAKVTPHFDGSTTDTPEWDYAWSGAVNNSVSTATPVMAKRVARVRFERLDGTVVRSGNPAWAPGGWAHAYDHEAPLGVAVQWRAIPILFDGTEGEPSNYVGTMLDPVTDGYVWLKPGDPNLALKVKIEPLNRSWNGRVDSTSIAGAHTPAVSWDVLEGHTSEIRLLVRDRETEAALMRVLDAGPILTQLPTCAGVEDFWFIRDKVQADEIHWDGYPVRRFSVGTIPVSRPTAVESPLFIPGLSYDTVAADWISYNQLEAAVDSYNDLLTQGNDGEAVVWDGGGPGGDTDIIIDGGQP